jgi:hypothetical protein
MRRQGKSELIKRSNNFLGFFCVRNSENDGQEHHRNTELFSKQSEQQREDDADENGGRNGEVKSELLFLNQDISWKPADPWNLLPNQEQNTDKDNENPKKN